jgi:hypothetical protein
MKIGRFGLFLIISLSISLAQGLKFIQLPSHQQTPASFRSRHLNF